MRRRRYPSDTTTAEWALIEPLLPTAACETTRGGRPEKHPRREIVDAIRYVVDTGCKGRALPRDYPPWRTVWGFMARWAVAGIVGRSATSSAAASARAWARHPKQSPRSSTLRACGRRRPWAWTRAATTPRRRSTAGRRHLIVDTRGLLLLVMVTPADMTDRDAAKEVLFRLRLMHPEITIVWADSAYAGALVTWAKTFLGLTIKTVSRPRNAVGFVVLPRRWVVERSLVWMMHAHRHARDYERLVQHSESLITWAAITLMTRRLTRRRPAKPPMTTDQLAQAA